MCAVYDTKANKEHVYKDGSLSQIGTKFRTNKPGFSSFLVIKFVYTAGLRCISWRKERIIQSLIERMVIISYWKNTV